MPKDDFVSGTYSNLIDVEKQKKEAIKPNSSDTTQPRNRDTTIPSNDDIIEQVRVAVKLLGKEAATYRFSDKEKKELADIVYNFKGKGIRTSENEITRIAVNYLVRDYKEKGKASVLAKVIERLNA